MATLEATCCRTSCQNQERNTRRLDENLMSLLSTRASSQNRFTSFQALRIRSTEVRQITLLHLVQYFSKDEISRIRYF